MSWNLEDYGKNADDPDQRARQDNQLALLRDQAADFICLQELWDDTTGASWLPNLLGEFAAALGMRGEPVPAPRSHCHMAILWRPWITLRAWETYDWTFHHGMGVGEFDIGADVPLRLGVTHLAPSNPQQRFSEAFYVARLGDPDQATIVAADWNCPGENDPEPDWSLLKSYKVVRRALWHDGPSQPPQLDRRPSQVLHRAGLVDVTRHLNRPWQPTTVDDLRADAFRASRLALPAVVDYGVLDTQTKPLSNHHPIWTTLDCSRLVRPCR